MESEESFSSAQQGYLTALGDWCGPDPDRGADAAAALGRAFFEAGLAPDEIIASHVEAVLKTVKPNDARGLVAAQQFLLEVMIAYGTGHSTRSKSLLDEARAATEREHTRALAAEQASNDHLSLLANITHELGTPLTVVRGNVAALRKYHQPHELLPAEIAVQEADLDAAIERMLSLREQLMAGAAETAPLELGPVILNRIVAQAARWAEPAAREKGLTLSFHPSDEDAMVSADDDALHSIVSNLLSNAIRYTESGGEITVSTLNDASTVSFSVTDTGIGLSDEDKSRIFDRFYRSPAARQFAAFGLGLGLSLTKDLVEALGGSIDVNGSPGRGSTFSVALIRWETDAAE